VKVYLFPVLLFIIFLPLTAFADKNDVAGTAESIVKELAASIPADDLPSIAFIPFANTSAELSNHNTGAGFSEILASVWNNKTDHIVMNRSDLSAVADEQSLSVSGMTDPKSSIKLGRLVSAQYIVTGTVSEVGNDVSIVARLVETTGGTIVASAQNSIPRGKLLPVAEASLLTQKEPMTAGFRSLLIPGWGQLYNGNRTRGFVFTGLWAFSAAGIILSEFNRINTYQEYISLYNTYQTEIGKENAVDAYEEANEKFDAAKSIEQLRLAFSYVLIGTIGIATADAIITASRNNRRIKNYGVRIAVLPLPDGFTTACVYRF